MKLKFILKKNNLFLVILMLYALFDCYEFTRLNTKGKTGILKAKNENSIKLRTNETHDLMKVFLNKESLLRNNILKYKDILVTNTSTSFLQLENRFGKDGN